MILVFACGAASCGEDDSSACGSNQECEVCQACEDGACIALEGCDASETDEEDVDGPEILAEPACHGSGEPLETASSCEQTACTAGTHCRVESGVALCFRDQRRPLARVSSFPLSFEARSPHYDIVGGSHFRVAPTTSGQWIAANFSDPNLLVFRIDPADGMVWSRQIEAAFVAEGSSPTELRVQELHSGSIYVSSNGWTVLLNEDGDVIATESLDSDVRSIVLEDGGVLRIRSFGLEAWDADG